MVEALFYAFFVGIGLGFLYDLMRFFRLSFGGSLFFDLLFWLITSFVSFSYLLIFNDGAIKDIFLAFIFVGFTVYIIIMGKISLPLEKRIDKKDKILLKKVKKCCNCRGCYIIILKKSLKNLTVKNMKVTNLAKESKSKSKKLYIGKYSVGKILVGLLLVGVFAFFSISVVNQNADISRLEKQKAEISAKYDAQQEENKELQAVLDNEDKDDYIEKKAREKGYVKSDEIVFYDISSGK